MDRAGVLWSQWCKRMGRRDGAKECQRVKFFLPFSPLQDIPVVIRVSLQASGREVAGPGVGRRLGQEGLEGGSLGVVPRKVDHEITGRPRLLWRGCGGMGVSKRRRSSVVGEREQSNRKRTSRYVLMSLLGTSAVLATTVALWNAIWGVESGGVCQTRDWGGSQAEALSAIRWRFASRATRHAPWCRR